MAINIGLDDVLLISPLLILFLFSLAPLTLKLLNGNREPNSFVSQTITMMGLVVAAVVTVALKGEQSRMAFDNALIFDGMSYWVGLLVLIATGVSLFLMFEHAAIKGAQFSEQIFLTLNAAVGMLVLLWSNDLIITFIGIEIMSLALYLMIAMSREENLAKEAAFKYFILGSFASAILLYGISFVYGVTGTTYLSDLAQVSEKVIGINKLFLVGFFLVVAGFCFKISIFPFHNWTPDVYQGAPTPITAFMATGVKLVTFTAFLRFIMTRGLIGADVMVDVLQWLAVLTMFVGNTTAILQNNFKRMLAYSSVSHSGYALVGLIAAGVSEQGFSGPGASGLIFYLFTYTVMTLGAFAFVSVLERNENSALHINDLKGFAGKYPVAALSLTVLMLSLAGLPPTLGFFGKFYVFSAAIGEGFVWLAVWAMINSVVAVYYYLRPIVLMYMYEGEGVPLMSSKIFTRAVLIVSVVVVIAAGLVSGPFYDSVQAAMVRLF